MRINKLLTVLLTVLVVFGLCFQAMAGNPEKKGTAGATELLIPMGARGTALAGSGLATISGIDAMYWNPAGLANSASNVEAMFSYLKYIADINITYGAVATKTTLGSLGFTFQSIAFGEIAETTEDSPNGTGSFFSPTYMTLGATFSRAMTDRIYIGVTAKFVSEKVMTVGASAFAFDMGVQYQTEMGVKLGVAMKNFGTPMKFDGTGLDREVELPDTPPGTPTKRLRLPGQKAELPSLLEIGLAYEMMPMEKAMVSFTGTFRNNNFGNDQLLGGVELSYDNMFFVRAGYDYSMSEFEDADGNSSYQFGPTFGFGLMQPVTAAMKLAFDFAYRTTTNTFFDNNMYFTAKLLF